MNTRCQSSILHNFLKGQPTFGRGGTIHSLCVTTPAGLGVSWLITLTALGARVGGPGLQADIGEEIAAYVWTIRPSNVSGYRVFKSGTHRLGTENHRTWRQRRINTSSSANNEEVAKSGRGGIIRPKVRAGGVLRERDRLSTLATMGRLSVGYRRGVARRSQLIRSGWIGLDGLIKTLHSS